MIEKLAQDVMDYWTEQGGTMIKASLSMKAFVYDALMVDNSSYIDVLEKDIRLCWMKMLNDPVFTGTFWETELGQSDFSNAGSLCHGWSAIPIYYICKYFSAGNK